jgi:hypothetical protein
MFKDTFESGDQSRGYSSIFPVHLAFETDLKIKEKWDGSQFYEK